MSVRFVKWKPQKNCREKHFFCHFFLLNFPRLSLISVCLFPIFSLFLSLPAYARRSSFISLIFPSLLSFLPVSSFRFRLIFYKRSSAFFPSPLSSPPMYFPPPFSTYFLSSVSFFLSLLSASLFAALPPALESTLFPIQKNIKTVFLSISLFRLPKKQTVFRVFFVFVPLSALYLSTVKSIYLGFL